MIQSKQWNPGGRKLCGKAAFWGGGLLAFLISNASLVAVTRQEYTDASAKWLDAGIRQKTMRVVKQVLSMPVPRPAGKPQAVYGRGEVVPVRPLANLGASFLALGNESTAKSYFDDVRLIFAAGERAVLDGYDDPTPELNGSTDQVSFALPELVRAYQVMVDLHQFNESEHERARELLLACARFRFVKMPIPGEGNLGTRYALGPVMVANALESEGNKDAAIAKSNLPLVSTFDTWRKWAAVSFRSILQYRWKDGAPTGRLKKMGKVGNAWVCEESPLPASPKPGIGFCEDSSGYGVDTIINFFKLIEAIPPSYLPELKNPAAWKELHDFIDGYRQLFLPIGIIPTFGDATWGPGSGTWISLYELAGKFFQDSVKWGNSAAVYRDTADHLFRYLEKNCAGVYGEDLDQAMEYMVENLQPVSVLPHSCLLMRQSIDGRKVPYKIILRGDATQENRETQPYVLLEVSPGESHTHGDVACLAAFGDGGSVLLHEAGYDAGPAFFHNQFLVRPASEPFLPFEKVFPDPKGTLLDKIDKNHKRVGDVTLGRDQRLVRDASMFETKYVSWGRVTSDYTLDGGYEPGYRLKYLMLRRQVALIKSTGMLVVFDNVQAKEPIKGVNVGPLWHVQNILATEPNRFLCQDDFQSILEPNSASPTRIGSPARPMMIALTGPPKTVCRDVPWRFLMRRGHEEITSRNHLYATSRCDLAEGETVSFITVFTPLTPGCTTLPADTVSTTVSASTGSVKVDHLQLVFGKGQSSDSSGSAEPIFKVTNGPYSASVFESGGVMTLRETP